MNRRTLGGLIVLNVALLVVLAILTIMPAPAQAQFAGGRAGDYVMLAMNPGSQPYETVVITDVNNSAMLSLYYNVSRRQFEVVAFRNIADDATAIRQGR